jgi:hypothetical protein
MFACVMHMSILECCEVLYAFCTSHFCIVFLWAVMRVYLHRCMHVPATYLLCMRGFVCGHMYVCMDACIMSLSIYLLHMAGH